MPLTGKHLPQFDIWHLGLPSQNTFDRVEGAQTFNYIIKSIHVYTPVFTYRARINFVLNLDRGGSTTWIWSSLSHPSVTQLYVVCNFTKVFHPEYLPQSLLSKKFQIGVLENFWSEFKDEIYSLSMVKMLRAFLLRCYSPEYLWPLAGTWVLAMSHILVSGQLLGHSDSPKWPNYKPLWFHCFHLHSIQNTGEWGRYTLPASSKPILQL